MASQAQETGTFTDKRDGKTYKTIKIGKQLWMAENLAYTNEDGGIYAVSYNDDENISAKYGKLYSLGVLTEFKGCPESWSLPTSADYEALMKYFGNDLSKLVGTMQIKFSGDYNQYGSNGLDSFTKFWTSTITDHEDYVDYDAETKKLISKGFTIFKEDNNYTYKWDPLCSLDAGESYSVRCVKK